jgi:hypothetical protein
VNASEKPRSRLLAQLAQQMEAATRAGQHQQVPRLRAQRAGLLVRHGDLDAARSELTALHQLAFASPHAELSAWLHLAEGLMAYFTNFGITAGERFLRADAMGRAASCAPVQAQAQGFLAMLAFNAYQFDAFREHLRRGFALAAPNDALARARLNMVVAMALHHGQDAEAAAPWYAKARSHAAAVGDDATLSALIHNTTQYRVAATRRASLRGQEAALKGLLPGVQSIQNYDLAMGTHGLKALTPLLQAQVEVINGNYACALDLFAQHLPEALSLGLERMGSSLMADVAWCRAQLGQHEAAKLQAQESELELDPSCDIDDQAATHSRLAQVFGALGLVDDAARHLQEADRGWRAFEAQQVLMCKAVQDTGLQPA